MVAGGVLGAVVFGTLGAGPLVANAATSSPTPPPPGVPVPGVPASWPDRPLTELYAEAWQRVLDGDQPA